MSAATITLLFLLFAVVMFVFEKIPLGVTSMIVCIGLVVTGVLDIKTAFAGFIDSNVILFVAMFIVGGALFETGMANKIGGIVTHFARSERSLIVAIMVIVGLMSGVLSNTGTAAVLIPVVIGIAAKSGYGCRPPRSPDGLCHRRLLRLRNAHRYARQHHGGFRRRLHLQGLCQGWPAPHPHRNGCQHGDPSHRISVLPAVIRAER